MPQWAETKQFMTAMWIGFDSQMVIIDYSKGRGPDQPLQMCMCVTFHLPPSCVQLWLPR